MNTQNKTLLKYSYVALVAGTSFFLLQFGTSFFFNTTVNANKKNIKPVSRILTTPPPYYRPAPAFTGVLETDNKTITTQALGQSSALLKRIPVQTPDFYISLDKKQGKFDVFFIKKIEDKSNFFKNWLERNNYGLIPLSEFIIE